MITKPEERKIHKVFIVSIILKGLNACIEFAIGISLFFATASDITRLSVIITQGELVEDPGNPVANWILLVAHDFSISSHRFLAYYLLFHGVIKLFLICGLLLNKRWSYPLAIVILTLFALYQVVQYFYTPSLWLLALTLFDVFILILIYHEYKYGRKTRAVL